MASYLYNHLGPTIKRIKRAKQLTVFLDYDGTLVGFKPRPEFAVPTNAVLYALRQLKMKRDINIIIITGRPLEDIRKMIAIKGIGYAGTHGQQVIFPDGRHFEWEKSGKSVPVVQRIKRSVIKESMDEKGILIEDKGTTIAMHYRKLDRSKVKAFRKFFTDAVKKFDKNGLLEVMEGSEVIEARPKGWNKGKAVGLIVKNMKERSGLVIYIGDDTTDEDAFSYLHSKTNAITIWVKNKEKRHTKAHYYLNNPKQVNAFIRTIL